MLLNVPVVADTVPPAKAFAVMVPALKLPLASRATTLLALFALVASTENVVGADPLNVPPVRYVPAIKALGVLAVIVMLLDPLKLIPLIVRDVCNVVAVVALPDSAAVIVPALKLPLASRSTTLLAVLVLTASIVIVAVEPDAVGQ